MKMAIDLNSMDLAASAAKNVSATQSAITQSADATQHPDPEVSITSTASLLARLQLALAESSAVDESRVDAIRKALAQGTYTIHADNIAHGLIQTELSLGQLTEI